MRIKRFFVLLSILVLGVSAKAQNLIRVAEDDSRTQTVSLNGNAEAVFVVGSDNFFIETSRPSLDKQKSVKKNSSGMWEYVIELKLQTQEGSAPGRTFTIMQSGSANKTTFKKGKFMSNKRYYFIVETVKNPIFLVDNTQPTDVHLKNDEAAIEINSLSEIEVMVDPKLACEITPSRTQAGSYSTLITVDMKKLNEMRSNVERQQMLYDDLNESLLDRAEHQQEVRDSEWYSLQVLQQNKEEAEAILADASVIRIKAKDSNELNIDISDLQAKQKRVYTVEMSGHNGEENSLHWMLLANYGLSNTMQHSFGLTIAWLNRFGFYVNFMTNGNFNLSSDMSESIENKDDYFWTDKTSSSRLSVTVGGLFAIKEMGYLYAGVGYGIRNLLWYTESGYSVAMTPGTSKGVALEAGMIFNIGKHMEISVGGLAQFPGNYYEMKLGLGYKF